MAATVTTRLASDVNICTHRVQTTWWLGASTVTARELALGRVARVPGSVGTRRRTIDGAVLGENKEWKEGEEEKRLGQHLVGYFSLDRPGPLGGERGGALVAVGGREPVLSVPHRRQLHTPICPLLLLKLFAVLSRSHTGSSHRASCDATVASWVTCNLPGECSLLCLD